MTDVAARLEITDVAARLETCFASVFPSVPARTLRVENRETIEAWDSLAFISLIILIEEEFGVNVKVENIAELTSFSSIMRYLQRELGRSPCDG
jgi:hypothetical protein